jgi:hypothetical protein
LPKATTSAWVLHDAGGVAEVRQVTQEASLAHAVSALQQELVRQVSQAATPVVRPQVIPPLDVLVDEEEDVELLDDEPPHAAEQLEL